MPGTSGGPAPNERRTLTVTERNPAEVASALRDWLGERVGAGTPPDISNVRLPEAGGMSSSTVLFDAEWDTGSGAFVARMAPERTSFPVFPDYDLRGQFEVMRRAAEHSAVPVPAPRWLQLEDTPLGTPFFVMDQASGHVPQDNPPYVFTGWLAEATGEQQERLRAESLGVLTQLHGIPDPGSVFGDLFPSTGGDRLREHVDAQHAYYRWALADDGVRVPIIERAFAWLADHWPTNPGPDVLCWGDARIGNIMYRDFSPVAVLDWELACLGPAETDVGWFVFLHRFFQDIAELTGVHGLPDLLPRSDVERRYRELTGNTLRDMDFYLVYAALRHAIVMARIKRRMISFGEDEAPDDPDDYVMHRASLDALLTGTYEWD